MSLKYYPKKLFFEKIEKMTLPDLESFIETMCKNLEANRHKVDACFEHRKYLLNDIFECTPDNVERLHRMADLVKERTAMLCKKGNYLYEQMLQIWKEERNEPFTDFRVDLSLTVSYNCEESVLNLEDDNSGSNYLKMSELLDEFYYKQISRNLIHNDRINYDPEEQEEQIFQPYDSPYKSDEKTNYWGEHRFFEKYPILP